MTQSHSASLDRPLSSNPDTSLANPNIPSAKLELTFPYLCGHRVAAEFDARVTVGQEDSVLLIGEVELFGYDNDHRGSYETCVDPSLCRLIRNYVENSTTEKDRAYEKLHQRKETTGKMLPRSPHLSVNYSAPKTASETKPTTRSSSGSGSGSGKEKKNSSRSLSDHGFGSFVNSYASTFVVPPNDAL
ncbi:hypothetical protein [Kiloniella sp.]|uniref:hypothetical protein n=1 Tax=Kiloniella sp. TaxID=1938587 RepID=UPI003A93A45D